MSSPLQGQQLPSHTCPVCRKSRRLASLECWNCTVLFPLERIFQPQIQSVLFQCFHSTEWFSTATVLSHTLTTETHTKSLNGKFGRFKLCKSTLLRSKGILEITRATHLQSNCDTAFGYVKQTHVSFRTNFSQLFGIFWPDDKTFFWNVRITNGWRWSEVHVCHIKWFWFTYVWIFFAKKRTSGFLFEEIN